MAALAAAARLAGDAFQPNLCNGPEYWSTRVVGHMQASDRDRMLDAPDRGKHTAQHMQVATSVATQTLLPGGTRRYWLEFVPCVSSHDGPGRA
jgi:hypothetical protein